MRKVPNGMERITLGQAIELFGTFCKQFIKQQNSLPANLRSKWKEGESQLLASNVTEGCGYNIRLDDPSIQIFKMKDDNIISIFVGKKEYSFDGLGWGDMSAGRARAKQRKKEETAKKKAVKLVQSKMKKVKS